MISGCSYTEDREKCSGGTSSCIEKAVCDICKHEYGELGNHLISDDWYYDNGYHFKEYFKEYFNRDLDLHSQNNGNKKNGATIVMYDGNNTLSFIFPQSSFGYGTIYATAEVTMNSDDPDKLIFRASQKEGGSSEFNIFREGSERLKVQKVLNAYNKYLDKHQIEFQFCELIYLDDDEIPELVYQDEFNFDSLLYYSNGKVHEFCNNDFGDANLCYREKTGEFCLSGINGSFSHDDYYKYENGNVTHKGSSSIRYNGEEEEFYIKSGYNSVSEKTYEKYVESFGDYDEQPDHEYTSLEEAYEKLSQK